MAVTLLVLDIFSNPAAWSKVAGYEASHEWSGIFIDYGDTKLE